ncbi:MAG: CHRD domain-containing protein [Rhodospirillaceae bacterium]|nr:MAG: CHRD domain-containing protein [Rhodospirillaceae bacterium]
MHKAFTVSLCALTASMAMLSASSVQAATEKMHVTMTAAQEVPPNDSKATGTARFRFNPATKEVTWSITTKDLSSAAVAAHIHGPAAPGANAGVVINLAPNGMANPLKGSAKLTDDQVVDLLGGKDYVNVHTTTNPKGEIRGQITP